MHSPLENKGVLTAVLQRFEKHRLPRIIEIKNLVDQGDVLIENDLRFLGEVLSDTEAYRPFVEEHAEYRDLFARVAHLYNEITSRALENEQRSG